MSLSRRLPATFNGSAAASAAVDILMALATGPTVISAEITTRLIAVNPPKIQLPTSISHGVTFATCPY
jgi:hypothetical protein